MKNPVLVTGATSVVGKEVVRSLVERGTRVRAMIFDVQKADDMNMPGVDIVIGDMRKEEDVRFAMNGIDKIYFITPLVKDMADITRSVVKTAKSEGVGMIVRQSVIDCGVDQRFEFWKMHRECEEIVKRSLIAHTFLRLNQLMQNFIRFSGTSIKMESAFRKPCGEGRTNFIDAIDAGACGAAVVDGNFYEERTFTLTGPAPLSNFDIAAELTKAIGKEVRYDDVDPAKAREELIDAGYGTWLADGMMEMYKVEMESRASLVSNDVERLIGKKPRSFAQFALDNAAALGDVHHFSSCTLV
jgi:uncharacterized protein YbjT (DUF2867 family)